MRTLLRGETNAKAGERKGIKGRQGLLGVERVGQGK